MIDNKKKYGMATKSIHSGQKPDKTTGAIMVPIYASSTYVQESPGKLRRLCEPQSSEFVFWPLANRFRPLWITFKSLEQPEGPHRASRSLSMIHSQVKKNKKQSLTILKI